MEFKYDGGGIGKGGTLTLLADGKKIGKTEKGAIWLTPDMTSPYAFYQFWINTDDRDVGRFLLQMTLMVKP